MTAEAAATAAAHGWREEVSDLGRGAAGGFLFGIPLLYTVEVWQYGSWVDPRWVLGAIGVAFLIVAAVNRTSGFRDARVTNWRDAAIDGVEMVAVGMVCAASVLFVLREITLDTSLAEALGKIVFEAIPFAFGAALARQFLMRAADDSSDDEEPADEDEPAIGRTLADAGAAAIGAVVLSISLAPTDEIPLIAVAAPTPWLLLFVGASLVISYAIVFQADFADQTGRRAHRGLFQTPLSETILAYVISLLVAGAMLAFFQRIGLDQAWDTWLAYTIVLGLPATIGAAAGRLAV